MDSHDFKRLLSQVDLSSESSIERYAIRLEGMTFRDILDLDIHPDGYNPKTYNSKNFKGGMGNLIEERYFGYKSNSDERPDFHEAGVELKATCYDIRKKDSEPTAGERLVLTMIPYDENIETDFYHSHLWAKMGKILLIFYHRDKTIDKYDQEIKYVRIFTPPAADLKIIENDYEQIAGLITSGRADELSEGMTTYLGACTKGANAATSWVEQAYPVTNEDGSVSFRKAKRRAFSLKRQYMDYVLHNFMMSKHEETESIASADDLAEKTFEQLITERIAAYVGMTDRQIAAEFGLEYKGNKAQWTTLVYRMLGIKGNSAEEFLKAGISVRVVRVEQNGNVRESMSFAPFEFCDLLNETWDDSPFRQYLDETKFFFVVFHKVDEDYQLKGSLLWNMPNSEIEGEAKTCWEKTRDVVNRDVVLTKNMQKGGKITFSNNLPGMADNRIVHVRPHAKRAAYLLEDGTSIGDIEHHGSKLPDGRWMTKQSFWFNNSYVKSILKCVIEKS